MTYDLKPLVIESPEPGMTRLILGIAGPSGSGKTLSALRLATGLAGSGKICVVDTENKRASYYANDFKFQVINLDPPFRPHRYQEAVELADKAGSEVTIIDSMSHEHEGPGGVLEWHEEEIERRIKGDQSKREQMARSAWIQPKGERNRLIQFALQRSRAHIIMCFRAKEKSEQVKDPQGGKTKLVNMGWQIIGAAEFEYETKALIILPAGCQGKPDWEQRAAHIHDYNGPLTRLLRNTAQITEETGKAIHDLCLPPPVAKLSEDEVSALKMAALDEAKKGTESFRSYWKTLSVAQREILNREKKGLQAAAESADQQPKGETHAA